MKLATIRTANGTVAARVDGDRLVETGFADVGALLARPGWQEKAAAAAGPEHPLDGADFAPLVPKPGKVVCVGLNYRTHILEMGRELPEFPTLFAKYPEALLGANDDIALAPESDAVDWEVELAVVLGATVRRATGPTAEAAIAGFAVLNDVTMRDWQFRTPKWDQGKTWEATTPIRAVPRHARRAPRRSPPDLDLRLLVNGELMQKENTSDLLFDPVTLVEYISTIVTLHPGDVIATGTPGGVGPRPQAGALPHGRRDGRRRDRRASAAWRTASSRTARDGVARGGDAPVDAAGDAAGASARSRGWTRRHSARPRALPGWNRSASARTPGGNAEAISNLVHWAATGERTPMYSSSDQRDADIAGRRRGKSGAELTDWFVRSSARLESAMDDLAEPQWAAGAGPPSRAAPCRPRRSPWMRTREVMVHAVDLGTGLGFDDLPADFLAALCDDVAGNAAPPPAPQRPVLP